MTYEGHEKPCSFLWHRPSKARYSLSAEGSKEVSNVYSEALREVRRPCVMPCRLWKDTGISVASAYTCQGDPLERSGGLESARDEPYS